MSSLEKPPVGTLTAKWRFPGVHPEGRKYLAIAATATVLIPWLTGADWFLFWPLAGFMLWVAAFFRDPVRTTPQGDDLIVSPADGLVSMIERVQLPPELAGEHALGTQPLVRVSIFMSVFDVHINRAPVPGTVRDVVYISGKFLNAELDKASEENERQHMVIEDVAGRRIGVTQIAGLLARRILTFVKPGDMVVAGQRFGLIRFGSRVDVWLPDDVAPQVALGQRAIAGETVIGRRGAVPAAGVSQ